MYSSRTKTRRRDTCSGMKEAHKRAKEMGHRWGWQVKKFAVLVIVIPKGAAAAERRAHLPRGGWAASRLRAGSSGLCGQLHVPPAPGCASIACMHTPTRTRRCKREHMHTHIHTNAQKMVLQAFMQSWKTQHVKMSAKNLRVQIKC